MLQEKRDENGVSSKKKYEKVLKDKQNTENRAIARVTKRIHLVVRFATMNRF